MEAVDAPVTWFNRGVGCVGVSVYMACTFCAEIVRETARLRGNGELMEYLLMS